jgi:hypothetical protein
VATARGGDRDHTGRPGLPARRVSLVTWPTACFAAVRSSLNEDALLERNGLRVHAQSWRQHEDLTSNKASECVRMIPASVERTVGDFIETYGAMNPGSAREAVTTATPRSP